MKCATCGAGLASVDVRCPFCQALTEFGHLELMEQKRSADEEAHRRREQAVQHVETESEKAASWTLKGLFSFGLMNFYHGLQALWVARKNDLVLPLRSKIALLAGVVHLALGSGLVSFGLTKHSAYHARVQSVAATLATSASRETLERDVACLLFEQAQQQSALGIATNTVCDGALELRGADVLLKDVHIERFGSSHKVNVCLRRSNTWQVSAVGEDVPCGNNAVAPVAAPAPPKKPSAKASPTVDPRLATIDAPIPSSKRSVPAPSVRAPSKDVSSDGNKHRAPVVERPKPGDPKPAKPSKKKRETL